MTEPVPAGDAVRCGLVQCAVPFDDPDADLAAARADAWRRHLALIEEAGRRGVQVLCLQESFDLPYFPPSLDPRWYAAAEPVPGPTVERLAELARRHAMAMVIPVFERAGRGVYYNTAAVVDADGSYLGRYRKQHLPHVHKFLERAFFTPGDGGYPVFRTRYATIGVYLCYDRHFPEVPRALALGGAEIAFNPSATVAGFAERLWKLEQPAQAVANGIFIGAVNRVGVQRAWDMGRYFGTSYLVDPRGRILAEGSADRDELVVADLDLRLVEEARHDWPFLRDRRPETYGPVAR